MSMTTHNAIHSSTSAASSAASSATPAAASRRGLSLSRPPGGRASVLVAAALGLVALTGLSTVAFAGPGDCPSGADHRAERSQQHFDRMDTDGDGLISVDELAASILAGEQRRAERQAACAAGDCGAARGERGPRGDSERGARGERGPRGDGERGARGERGLRGDGERGARGERGAGGEAHAERRAQMREQMQARFAAMDTNGDGVIDAAEARRAAQATIAEHDADGDGKLSIDELPQRPMHRGPHGPHGRHGGQR